MTSQNILEDFQPQDEFAAANGLSEHTVSRYRLLGLPWMLWGGRVHIHLPGARKFIADRIRRRSPRRGADV